MLEITAQNVWQSLTDEPRFQKQPDAFQEVTRPFAEKLPEILADWLFVKVTLKSLLEARIAFLHYCLDNGYIDALIRVWPNARPGLANILQQMLSGALSAHLAVLADPKELLSRLEMSEAEYVVAQFELNETMASQYLAGELLLGDLLVAQPLIFVRHT